MTPCNRLKYHRSKTNIKTFTSVLLSHLQGFHWIPTQSIHYKKGRKEEKNGSYILAFKKKKSAFSRHLKVEMLELLISSLLEGKRKNMQIAFAPLFCNYTLLSVQLNPWRPPLLSVEYLYFSRWNISNDVFAQKPYGQHCSK